MIKENLPVVFLITWEVQEVR